MALVMIFSYGKVLLEVAAYILVILACLKYLRDN